MCLQCLGLVQLSCPPDCLVKSDIKAPSYAAIFRLGIVVLQCVRAGQVFCGLHVAHVRIICPVRDVTHVRKCTRPSPAIPYCKRREAGRGPGNEATKSLFKHSGFLFKCLCDQQHSHKWLKATQKTAKRKSVR